MHGPQPCIRQLSPFGVRVRRQELSVAILGQVVWHQIDDALETVLRQDQAVSRDTFAHARAAEQQHALARGDDVLDDVITEGALLSRAEPRDEDRWPRDERWVLVS